MQQMTKELKTGKIEILEVPFPALGKKQILVRNHFSVISVGTESKTITDARKGYIGKARSRKKEIRQVIESIKTNGFVSTYNRVMNKLEAPSAMGYSSSGEVIAVGSDVTEFCVGDLVACGGDGAFHADVISIPVKLAVKVPNYELLKQSAFTTISSIAIQGIRQAHLNFGENCLIIGMGLIGQLTYKMLDAFSIRPIGIDISKTQVELSKSVGLKHVYERNEQGLDDIINNYTDGFGVDSVIIAAGTSSLDPINFAGKVARQKGKVVVLGAVATGFERANYYRKELDLRMSTSYGPGRYDSNYEEKGNDYPIGYVRWTENRNMQSFINMLSTGKLDIEPLITHEYSLEDAPAAYDMIISKKEPFAGIVIQYNDGDDIAKRVELKSTSYTPEDVNAGFIGAGSFAQGSLLPNMKGLCNFIGVATGRGNTSKYVGNKYEFNYCASSGDDIIHDNTINTVFITTRHNLHADYVLKAIENNKHVFVEKPLAMNEDELLKILSSYNNASEGGYSKHLMVGFNRRFAPATKFVKELFNNQLAKSISIRINAGILPPNHWVNDPMVGGGRIIGEVCHFIDLASFLANSPIISVSAEKIEDVNRLPNTVIINLKMENGSIASINYFSNGSSSTPKERIEIFCGGTIALIDDFKTLTISDRKIKNKKFRNQDKGVMLEIQSFLNSIKTGNACPIPFKESYASMLATFKVVQSISEGRKINI
jgi:polar amino acid transport system substrate-binding protein